MLRGWRGWMGFLVVLALALVLLETDRRMKRPPHAGFAAADASWTIFTPDAPHLLDALAGAAPLTETAAALEPYVAKFQLAVRQGGGIRPTPARWRLWLGPQLLLWGRGEEWIACVHPGLLLKLVHTFNAARQTGVRDGIYRYQNVHYAWRGSFLSVSPSREAIEAVLGAPMHPANAGPPHRLLLTWQGPPGGALTLKPGADGPISGELQLKTDAAPAEAALPVAMEGPLFSISARKWRDIVHTLSLALPAIHGLTGLDANLLCGSLATALGAHDLTDEWDAGTTASILSLQAVDFTAPPPVPILSLAQERGSTEQSKDSAHPLQPLAGKGYSLAYAWGELQGTVTPVWGEAVTLSLAQESSFYLATSQQSRMEQLVQQVRSYGRMEADLVVAVDWRGVAAAGEQLLRLAAEHEMLPRLNSRDLDREIIPLLQSLGDWGTLDITGRAAGEVIQFSGRLFGGAGASP